MCIVNNRAEENLVGISTHYPRTFIFLIKSIRTLGAWYVQSHGISTIKLANVISTRTVTLLASRTWLVVIHLCVVNNFG
jgi:hypothetical protein